MTNNNTFNKLMSSPKKTTCVIVLPPLGELSDLDIGIRNWLSRSKARFNITYNHPLNNVLPFFGEYKKVTNYGALRYLGETSQKPQHFIAAADPILLHTQRDQLNIKTIINCIEIKKEILEAYIEIQNQISNNFSVELIHNGFNGYMLCKKSFPSSLYSPYEISGQAIHDVMPSNDLSRKYGKLINEIQMIIHNSDFIKHELFNSLWVWGGGELAPHNNIKLPKLFSDDPILRGYWSLTSNESDNYEQDFEDFLSNQDGAFVVVTPENTSLFSSQKKELELFLSAVYRYYKKTHPEQLVLIFRDGWQMQIKPLHKYFFWRNTKSLQSIKSLYYAN